MPEKVESAEQMLLRSFREVPLPAIPVAALTGLSRFKSLRHSMIPYTGENARMSVNRTCLESTVFYLVDFR
jgi:hypothetical protein